GALPASRNARVPSVCATSALTCCVRAASTEHPGPELASSLLAGGAPTPSARSRPSAPVETTCTSFAASASSFMIEPLPNCFSIWDSAAANALDLLSSIGVPLFLGWHLRQAL